jgi:hypothetical protein
MLSVGKESNFQPVTTLFSLKTHMTEKLKKQFHVNGQSNTTLRNTCTVQSGQPGITFTDEITCDGN